MVFISLKQEAEAKTKNVVPKTAAYKKKEKRGIYKIEMPEMEPSLREINKKICGYLDQRTYRVSTGCLKEKTKIISSQAHGKHQPR